jgi:hypothetical protein
VVTLAGTFELRYNQFVVVLNTVLQVDRPKASADSDGLHDGGWPLDANIALAKIDRCERLVDTQEVCDHESSGYAHALFVEVQLREAFGAQLLERDAAEALEGELLEPLHTVTYRYIPLHLEGELLEHHGG